ncbi:MAG: dephospho-CoA kinase [Burkholderiaceae bacterium]
MRIGLTGGIGSGKSTVARRLAAHGAAIFDTDAIAREVSGAGGDAIAPLREEFGAGFIDAQGALDRAAMRTLAFSDPTARRRLEAILHPLIGAEVERRAGASRAAVQVFDVPLLVESRRWRARVDRVLVVDCTEATQIDRVVARSGWSAEAVRAVLAQQATREARRASADAVLYNEAIPLAELARQVARLWGHWQPARVEGVWNNAAQPPDLAP